MLLPENRIPTHPGEILSKEFLAPLGITQVALAAHIGVPVQVSLPAGGSSGGRR